MNEKLEMAKNSLYNANEIKDIKENPVVESVLLAPIKAIPGSKPSPVCFGGFN